MSTNNKETQNKKDNKTVWLLAAAGVIIVLLLLLLLRSCGTEPAPATGPQESGKPTFDTSVDGSAQEGSLEGLSQEEIQAALNEQVANGAIAISMSLNPTFEDGTSEGQLLIQNDEMNKWPQVVEIYLVDDEAEDGLGELLYKSGAIPVGSRVDTGKLLVDLDKGEYQCVAYFNAIDGESGELMGKAGANVKITIKS